MSFSYAFRLYLAGDKLANAREVGPERMGRATRAERAALLTQEGSAARPSREGEPPLAWSRLRLDHAVLL